MRFLGSQISTDLMWRLVMEGKVWIAGDGDQNDTITGQTSFANTTPSLMIDVPAGTTVVPVYVDLSQTGTVAGGDIELIIELDNADRYNTGGTAETAFNARTDIAGSPRSGIYSGATANAGFGQRVFSADIAADVSPAEGILPGPLYTPTVPFLLVGPAAFLVFSHAAVTGPTWLWSTCWVELLTTDLPI